MFPFFCRFRLRVIRPVERLDGELTKRQAGQPMPPVETAVEALPFYLKAGGSVPPIADVSRAISNRLRA